MRAWSRFVALVAVAAFAGCSMPPLDPYAVAKAPVLTQGDFWSWRSTDDGDTHTMRYEVIVGHRVEVAGERHASWQVNVTVDGDAVGSLWWRRSDMAWLRAQSSDGEQGAWEAPRRCGWMSWPAEAGIRWQATCDVQGDAVPPAWLPVAPGEVTARITTLEHVRTPAGTFAAYRVEGTRSLEWEDETGVPFTFWYAPAACHIVREEAAGIVRELMAYRCRTANP